MYKLLKPYVFPILLLIVGWLLNMATPDIPILFGVIIGFASFWIVLAIFSNKPLIRKFPGVLEWIPFLDPSGGLASASQLTGKYIQGQSFNLSMVAHDGIVTNRTFDDCDIFGPAVVFMTGVGQAVNCGWDGLPENTLIVSQYFPHGAIVTQDCNFRNCRFYRISLVGPEELITKMKSGFIDTSGLQQEPPQTQTPTSTPTS